MEAKQLSRLLEDINHAGLDFAHWPRALAAIAEVIGVKSVAIGGQKEAADECWVFEFGVEDKFAAAYAEHFHAINPIWRATAAAPAGSVYSDRTVMPFSMYSKSEFYNDFLVRQGLTSMAGAVLRVDRGWQTVLGMHSAREFTTGQIDVLKTLTPHLISAIEMNTRLALSANAAAKTLEHMDLIERAAFIVDGNAKVLKANKAALQLLSNGLPLDRRSPSLVFNEANSAKLRAAVRACTDPRAPHRVKEFVLSSNGHRAMSGIVSSIAAEVPWRLSTWPAALVLISPLNAPSDPLDRFGFTTAEAKLARELMKGDGVSAAAERLGVARSTVRTHLARIFEKTQTKRQAELLLALLGKR